MQNYSGEIFVCAFRETVNFFGWNIRTLTLPALFLVGSAIHIWRFGWSAAMDEFQIAVSYGLAPVSAFAILLFLWNVFITPSRLLREAVAEISDKLSDRPTLEAVAYPRTPSQHWRHVDVLKIWEAACLLENEEPTWPIKPGMASFGAIQALLSAVDSGLLPADKNLHRGTGRELIRIKQDDFLKYCVKILGKVPDIFDKATE